MAPARPAARGSWAPVASLSLNTEAAIENLLYAVYLGGDPAPGRPSEDHEVVVVVAANTNEARRVARAKWGGESRPHVDAVKVISVVDGYSIQLVPTNHDDSVDVDATYEPDDGDLED